MHLHQTYPLKTNSALRRAFVEVALARVHQQKGHNPQTEGSCHELIEGVNSKQRFMRASKEKSNKKVTTRKLNLRLTAKNDLRDNLNAK